MYASVVRIRSLSGTAGETRRTAKNALGPSLGTFSRALREEGAVLFPVFDHILAVVALRPATRVSRAAGSVHVTLPR